MKRSPSSITPPVVLLTLLACAPVLAAGWADTQRLERFLATADVAASAKVGAGVTDSVKLTLTQGEETYQAIFKDFDRPSDSWRREVAAYELDRLLGLGMVPPTVERKHRGRRGCVQLWVEGQTMASAGRAVDLADWRQQVSEMWLFDYLTGNIDRHVNNALMTPDQRLVLIDNSKAFQTHPQILAEIDAARGATRARFWLVDYDPSRRTYPTSYRPSLIGSLRSLEEQDLKPALGRYLDRPERRSLLERRDAILEQLDRRLGRAQHYPGPHPRGAPSKTERRSGLVLHERD